EVVQVMTIPRPLKVGIGGPVGSGKTALAEALCRRLRDSVDMAVITNDIYTKEDAEFLVRRGALPAARVVGVETGGCPHTAIREDASVNLEAVHALTRMFPGLDLLLIESGGDNLAATFSPELVDATIYVIDVAEGEKIPRKGGPGITRSDLLVINKIDLAPHVGADLGVMERDARRQRGARPFVFTNLRSGAHACLTTPSATKVYRTVAGPAEQTVRLTLAPGARLEWVPDHTIPFAGSAFQQRVEAEVPEGAALVLIDAFAAGRVARGEAWRFALLDSALSVRDARGWLL